LVDDCQDYSAAFRLMAISLGHNCDLISDWTIVADNLVDISKYDIVLFDNILGLCTGQQLAEKNKRNGNVVIVTGAPDTVFDTDIPVFEKPKTTHETKLLINDILDNWCS
jgi:hypothetical protein